MYSFQKVTRNGNSAGVTIPRRLLAHMDLLPGDVVRVELQEDGTLLIRPFENRNVAPFRAIVRDDAAATVKP